MSYLGKVELKASEIRRIDVTGSTSATHTLTWTPPSEQSLIITINGIKQQNNYSISGTTLTLDTALTATDEMEVVGILDIGEAVTPPDDSISTVKIQDDAVTAAKLANSINTEIAANTAKVTNATHTGDVTGATALTIAANAVTLAKLEDGTQGDILYYGASGAPTRLGFGTSGDFLKTQGTGANPVWATLPSSGTANEPNFFVKSTSDQVWAGSYDNFTLPTVVSESDAGSWDTTNYKFTVPSGKGGVYMFVIYFLAANGNNYYVRTYINGTTEGQYRSSSGTVSGNHVIQGVFHHDLAAADEVEVQHYTGGSFTNGGATFFGFRIST